MKNVIIRTTIIVLIAIIGVGMADCARGNSTPIRHFNYSGTETITITGYTGPEDVKIIIPAQIKGKNVIAIGDNVFENKYPTSIDIPDSIISIGENAFS